MVCVRACAHAHVCVCVCVCVYTYVRTYVHAVLCTVLPSSTASSVQLFQLPCNLCMSLSCMYVPYVRTYMCMYVRMCDDCTLTKIIYLLEF